MFAWNVTSAAQSLNGTRRTPSAFVMTSASPSCSS